MNDLVEKPDAELRTIPASTVDMSPLIQLVADGKVSPEQLKEMQQLQRDHEADQARKAFHHAMAEFRKRVPKIEKDSVVDFTSKAGRTNYKHTSLQHAMNVVNPLLGDLGLNPSWLIDDTNATMIRVTCVLTHKDGHSEETSLSGPPDQSGNKNAIQARASTVTYLQRYTLFSICGLASSEDTDGDGGATEKQEAKPKPAIPDKKFKEWYKDFQKRVEAGELTASAVISQLQTKYTLSDEQHTSLVNLRDCEPVQK